MVQLALLVRAALGPRRRHRRLLERLRDPQARQTDPARDGDPERGLGQQLAEDLGPGRDPDRRGAEPGAQEVQGKTLAEVAKERGGDAIEALLDFLVEDQAYTRSRCSG